MDEIERLQAQIDAAERRAAQAESRGDTAGAQANRDAAASYRTRMQEVQASTAPTPPPTPAYTELPPATIDPATADANFLAGISGKTLNELTPEEINKLIEIQRKSQAEALGASAQAGFAPLIDAASKQEKDIQSELTLAEKEQARKLLEEQGSISSLLTQQFAPRFGQLARQGEKEREDLQRSFSFSGTGRGTRAQEKRQESLRNQAQLESALAAEKMLQERLLVAQAQGESKAVLDGIRGQLSQAKNARVSLETAQAQRMAEINAELAAKGSSQIQDLLATLQPGAFDKNLSEALGQIVDANGRSLLDAAGNPLQFASINNSPVDEVLSAQVGILVDEGRNPILDDQGNQIPYRPGLQGFTTLDGAIIGIFQDGTAQILAQGTGGGSSGGSGGSGSGGTSLSNDSLIRTLVQQANAGTITEAQVAQTIQQNFPQAKRADALNTYYQLRAASASITDPGAAAGFGLTSLPTPFDISSLFPTDNPLDALGGLDFNVYNQ